MYRACHDCGTAKVLKWTIGHRNPKPTNRTEYLQLLEVQFHAMEALESVWHRRRSCDLL